MKEYIHYDGSDFTTFNIIETRQDTITVAVTHIGKISVTDYELYTDNNGLYFEYGPLFTKIYVADFEEVA